MNQKHTDLPNLPLDLEMKGKLLKSKFFRGIADPQRLRKPLARPGRSSMEFHLALLNCSPRGRFLPRVHPGQERRVGKHGFSMCQDPCPNCHSYCLHEEICMMTICVMGDGSQRRAIAKEAASSSSPPPGAASLVSLAILVISCPLALVGPSGN